MKKIIFIVILIFTLMLVMGCTPGSGIQISTPVPDAQTDAAKGQIDIPGFKVQFNAPGMNPLINTADAHGQVAGILAGLWHGVISPGTLVVSLFNPNVQMYEVHNDGSAYNFGFMLGIAIIFTIIGLFLGRRRRISL